MFQELIKILAVEDNDFDFELVERKLKELDFGFEIKRVLTEEDFKKLLIEFCPDLILSDFSLPSFTGLDALKIAKDTSPLIPFIFVSGAIGEEMAVNIMIQGANDYVLKDNLNKLVPAIKRALNEAKEKEKRKQAEIKLEVKVAELKNLIYRISHDIRGPICSIKGVVNLIQQLENKKMEKILEYNEIIGQVTKKMEGIVSNLSSFQFIYEEETCLDEINLKDFMVNLKNAVSEIDGYDEIDFQINSNGSEYISCKQNLLHTILFNLIHNSCVFKDKSKGVHRVFASIDVSEKEIRLAIEDNGIGIPDNIKGKIFDMFYRGTTLSRGAGLGLYITKTILEKLNGEINLESKESVGTRVNVSIPFIS
jgi:K+-sensing histidine kinase KdpD